MKSLEIHNDVSEAQKSLKAGDKVLVTRDDGSVEERFVKYPPGKLNNNTWVVWLQGISGCYALCRVQPLAENAQ